MTPKARRVGYEPLRDISTMWVTRVQRGMWFTRHLPERHGEDWDARQAIERDKDGGAVRQCPRPGEGGGGESARCKTADRKVDPRDRIRLLVDDPPCRMPWNAADCWPCDG